MTTTPHRLAQALEAPLLKVRDVASVLSISRQSVRALADSGQLAAHELKLTPRKKQRTHVRITRASLEAFYEKRFKQKLETALRQPLCK
jgi:hypothetical protein